MAKKLLELGGGIELWEVGIDDAREQDVNARHMNKEAFDRLQSTIGRDKRLESLPLLALVGGPIETGGHLEVVSGHHRTRAARAAGMPSYHALVDVTGLTPDQIKAKQLAHNSIQGEDNAQLLAEIFKSIGDVDARLESFIDPKTVEGAIKKIQLPPIELDLKYRQVMVMFIPYELGLFEDAIKEVKGLMSGENDGVYLADLAQFEQFKAITKRIGFEYDIRSIGTVMAKWAEIALASLGDDRSGDADWVALRDIFKSAHVPAAVAKVIEEALAKMEKDKTLTSKNRWQALEYWAADYNGGA